MGAEISSALAPIDDLLIIGPSASARAATKDAREDLRQLARDLGADAVLSGSLELLDSRLRLQMRITRGSDGAVLWARTWSHGYEQFLADRFNLQRETATQVAAVVHRKLLRQPVSSSSLSSEAMIQYRRGALQLERHNGPAILKASGLFQSEVVLDPSYTSAWAP